jgi:excinuclease UvrABC ATPase subunit
LFSFNSPLGACPKCRGFGRVIDIDYRLAIPDQTLSIDDGALKCWEGEVYGESKEDLLKFTKKKKIPTERSLRRAHARAAGLRDRRRARLWHGTARNGRNIGMA